ncbi:hypothetical protein DVR12_07950, partial [Chitinophaga silvatica]
TANPTYAVANILKKITFPTGGYRQFIYEGNTALYYESPDKYHPDPSFTAARSFSNSTFTTGNIDPDPCLKQNFTISSYDGGAYFTFNILGLNGITCTNYRAALFSVSSPSDLTGGTQILNFANQLTAGKELSNGYYRIEVYKLSPTCTMTGISGTWTENTLTSTQISVPQYGYAQKADRKVGGVRVQEVRDYDPITAKTSSTYYKYQLYSVDSTLTSGLLVSPVDILGYTTLPNGCSFVKLIPQGSYPLSTQDNSFVVYPQVRTIESGNGWIDNTYSYVKEVPPVTNPETPTFDQSYMRGLLTQQVFYDQTGKLLKKSVYGYSYYLSTPSQVGVRIKPFWAFDVGAYSDSRPPLHPNDPPALVYCATYNVAPNIALPAWVSDSTITSYGVGTGVRTDYNYIAYQRGYLLKSEVTTINNGQTRTRTYKYASTPQAEFLFPWSTNESGTTIAKLIANNYRQPIEIVDSLKPATGAGSFVKGDRYYFGVFSAKYHVEKMRSYSTPTIYTEYNISLYDSKGNPMEVSRTGGTTEVYLWGYGRSKLVGIVKGASYSTVSPLFDPTTLDQNPPGPTTLRTQMNLIRTGLASTKAQVSSFIWHSSDNYDWEIDPAGKQTTYFADFLGRLYQVSDFNNYIRKNIEYKIAGTN